MHVHQWGFWDNPKPLFSKLLPNVVQNSALCPHLRLSSSSHRMQQALSRHGFRLYWACCMRYNARKGEMPVTISIFLYLFADDRIHMPCHHPPYEANQLPGYGTRHYVKRFPSCSQRLIPLAKPCIGPVRIGYDFRSTPLLFLEKGPALKACTSTCKT